MSVLHRFLLRLILALSIMLGLGSVYYPRTAAEEELSVVAGTVLYKSQPLPGVTVFADLDGDKTLGQNEPFAVTSEPDPGFPLSGGDYRIEGIPAGAVEIRIINRIRRE